MIKFQAFGDEDSLSDHSNDSTVHISREAQEDVLNKLYIDALQAASRGEKDEAIELLEELRGKLELDSIINDTLLLERLKYLTYKNLGFFKNDLKSILQALEIDNSDFNLWITAGRKSKEEHRYLLGKTCFETAFQQNSKNLIVIDNLIEIYFIMNDFYNCANMCLFALEQDSEYSKALILFNECLGWDRALRQDVEPEYLRFVSTSLGGSLDMDTLMTNARFETYKSNLLKSLKQSQQFLFKPSVEEDFPQKKKLLTLSAKKCTSLKEIGRLILNFYEQIQDEGLSMGTQIQFEDYLPPPPVEAVEIVLEKPEESAIPLTQEKAPDEASHSQDGQASLPEDTVNSKPQSPEFNITDFIDKRRSTRNRSAPKQSAHSGEARSELDTLLELFPSSLRKSSSSSDLSKENSQSSIASFGEKIVTEEKLLIEEFLVGLRNEFQRFNDRMNVYMLIRFYLIQVAHFKNCYIPEEFMQMYKLFRKVEELPASYKATIPEDITVEKMILCLTANEIVFDENESSFLDEMKGRLIGEMSESDYRGFVVRLQVLLGNAKWELDHLSYARDLCRAKPEFDFVFGLDIAEGGEVFEVIASNHLLINEVYLENALEMLSFTSNDEGMKHFTEVIRSYFTKLEIDLSRENKDELCDAIIGLKIWAKGIQLIDGWQHLTDHCFELIYHCVVENNINITPNLARKVAKRAIDGRSFDLWKILQVTFENEHSDVKTLVQFYTIAHSALGRHSLCTAENGKFLLKALEVFEKTDADFEAECCYSCLFGYPPNRTQQVHNSPEIALEWQHCNDMINFLFYEELPEYDTCAKASISNHAKDLFLKVLRLIPPQMNPVKSSEFIKNYVFLGSELGEEFEKQVPSKNDVTSYIYYYLADFFFKNKKDFSKAKQYYIFDLSLNLKRFDSWASLGLSINFEIDDMLLEGCPSVDKFLKRAFAVFQCFDQALKLRNCSKLWIEYGLLAYNLASFLSRNKKLQTVFQKPIYEATTFANEKLAQMNDYDFVLQKAKNCFEHLAQADEVEEPWLINYMLGKISEKNMANIDETLQYYEWSAASLYLDGASYPKKIQFVNNRVPHLSVEALEIHYRIHSCIIKYLSRNPKFSARNLRRIKMFLIKTQNSPFITRKQYSEKKSKNAQDEDFDVQIKQCVDDVINIVCEREMKFDVNNYRRDLVKLCVSGVLKCLERFPNYYKSYFRFAERSDSTTAMGLLFGTLQQNRQNPALNIVQEGKKRSVSVIPGLFNFERNFFGSVWRLPVDEIDRSGKFYAHMFRLTNLFIDTCNQLEDYKTLQQMYTFLSKTPEVDKRFLNEPERVALAHKANQLYTTHINNILTRIKSGSMSAEEMQQVYQQFAFALTKK